MKNTLIISAFILTSAAFSQAESSFKYDLVGIHYGHYSYDDDDVDANGISFSLINEISPRVLIGVSGVTAKSEYTFSNHKIRTTGIGLGFDIGTYVPINNKLDLVGTIGFGRVSYDTKISGSLVNEKESDKTTIASMDLGARIHLDQNQKIEL